MFMPTNGPEKFKHFSREDVEMRLLTRRAAWLQMKNEVGEMKKPALAGWVGMGG